MADPHYRDHDAEQVRPGEWRHTHPHGHRPPVSHDGLLPEFLGPGGHPHYHPGPDADGHVPDHQHLTDLDLAADEHDRRPA